MTRLVCTSDWHGFLPRDLPDGDILIIAGDTLPMWDHNRQFQADWIRHEFFDHLAWLPHSEIILIAGNHDFVIEESKKIQEELKSMVCYLQDETVEIDGIKFHGTPWVPNLKTWAFYADDIELERKCKSIPEDTNVIISHGPPFGSLDKVVDKYSVGSKPLRERIVDIKPTLVVTGHIHEGYGKDMIGRTTIVNASFVDENYYPVNKAIVIDLI